MRISDLSSDVCSADLPAKPDGTALALVRFDIVDRVLDGGDLFRRIVGDLDAEFLFERHHQFDDIEAVGTQIVDEARFLGHLLGFDAEMFDDDLFHLFGRIAHASSDEHPSELQSLMRISYPSFGLTNKTTVLAQVVGLMTHVPSQPKDEKC